MNHFLPFVLAIVVIAFIIRIIFLITELFKNYRSMRKKYPVSIWKMPSQNLNLMDEKDRRTTKKLYLKYALNLIFGMLIIIGLSALVINYSE